MEELKILFDKSGLNFPDDRYIRSSVMLDQSVCKDTALAMAKQHESLMTTLRDDRSYIIFLCEDNERVVAARALLCAGCEVIRNMLMSGMKESRA
ncbi:hypothetical protein R1flu_022301 [Riccia fluitans]|uniref:Rhodanese domain-containing protein n=1 Tax=Riccia fluitans TaxID=41844 RepID=A0ABD1ZRU7_9MARC